MARLIRRENSRLAATALAVAAIALTLPSHVSTSAPSAGTLRTFYIAGGPGFNDWSYRILAVEPAGRAVRVRYIRFASVNEFCPDVRVLQAVERTVESTVQDLARGDLCEMSPEMVDAAVHKGAAVRVNGSFGTGAKSVVANCGGRERVLNLNRSTLWTLVGRLDSGMFRAHPDVVDTVSEAHGTSLLPELRSTKYAAAFGDELVWELEGYAGPPTERRPLPAQVIGLDERQLLEFVPATTPPIALVARISGDVRLRLTVDPKSGAVSYIDKLEDKPIIGDTAVEAARSWKFDPAQAPRKPVDVTLRFRLACRND